MADRRDDRRNRFGQGPKNFRMKYAMETATRSASRHPARLVSVVLVDGALTAGAQYQRLTCYGAFEVDLVEGSPAFTSHHVSTTENASRTLLLRDLGALSQDSHVVLGSSRAQHTFWDRGHILEAGLSYLYTISELEVIEPSNLDLMSAPELAMTELANTVGLPISDKEDVLGQARAAGVRAQLVWLAYVASKLGPKETRNLFAAFQAWQAIEMARPVPF